VLWGCKYRKRYRSRKKIAYFFPLHPTSSTPTITRTVPTICSVKIGSPRKKCACRIVDTGPMLVTIAALLAPIRFMPVEIR